MDATFINSESYPLKFIAQMEHFLFDEIIDKLLDYLIAVIFVRLSPNNVI